MTRDFTYLSFSYFYTKQIQHTKLRFFVLLAQQTADKIFKHL